MPAKDRRPRDTTRATEDLRSALQSNSQRVDLAALAAKRRSARMVTREVLERVMLETIENVLLSGDADPVLDRSSLRDRTREEFDRLMESHRQASTERDRAEQARTQLEQQVRALKLELEQQNARLQREIERAAPRIRFSETSLATMEKRLHKTLAKALNEYRADSPGDVDVGKVERRLQQVVDETVETERAKAKARALEVRDIEVERLQQRIDKLNRALDSTETTLRQVAASKTAEPGGPVARPAGSVLPGSDINQERKRDLIQVVFVNNLLLRDREVRPEDLEGIPEDYLITARPSVETPRDLGFVAPVDSATDETAF